ncbi:acyl-CoA dehydrogenase family protein [Streptosporangium sp. NPDC051023]|uniref:acyl-CoA dehydrogenase family protein n=1 Tax=Streptosporangium sp. NPDC051023 TaxID=3155410 RepID=UPI0034508368
MTAVTNVPGQGFPAPPEPALTPLEVIARAEAIAPTLVGRQSETEHRTYYSQETHREFAAAGFYRILVPRRYGGYEFGIDTFMRVTMALARGCPSTAWMYCLGATHAIAAATLFGEEAQAEIFRDGDFICPATIVPSGSAVRTAEGDWVLNGTWNYCSGAPYATHFIGHALVRPAEDQPPAPMLFIAPRSQWRRLDDWGRQLGLKGSGSHSITVEDGRLPAAFALPGVHLSEATVTGGTPGRDLHGNPEYGGGPLSYMVLEIASLAVGIARGALDVYGDLMRSRNTLLPPIVGRAEDPDYQFWYAEASGMIAAAEAGVFGAIQQWRDLCAQGPAAFTREQDLRITTICRHTIRLCWTAVESYLFPTAGSSSVRQGERLERVWRDMSMLHSHSGFAVFLPTVANREFTRVHFAAR